jgi:hypothetical protein
MRIKGRLDHGLAPSEVPVHHYGVGHFTGEMRKFGFGDEVGGGNLICGGPESPHRLLNIAELCIERQVPCVYAAMTTLD